MNITLKDLFVNMIVDSVSESDTQDVVQQISSESGSMGDKLTLAFDSGVAEGASRACDVFSQEVRATDNRLVEAVERIDVELTQAIDPETVAVLRTIREPMFEYLTKRRKTQLDALGKAIIGRTNVSLESLTGEEISDDEAIRLGIVAMTADLSSYGGFLSYGEDRTMECYCPNCLGRRWRDAGNGAKEFKRIAERERDDREGSRDRMAKFGHYIMRSLRHAYNKAASQVIRAPKAPNVADASIAAKHAQDVMAGIMGKPKKE